MKNDEQKIHGSNSNLTQNSQDSEHVQDENNNNQDLKSSHSTTFVRTKQNRNSPKRNSLLSLFLSATMGGIISALVVALLFMNEIIPVPESQTTHENEEQTSEQTVKTLSSENEDEISSNVEEVSKAVVGVINLQNQSIWTPDEEAGTGSGIIYKKKDGQAYIVTNHHVVKHAKNIEVALNDGKKRIPATLIGSDELTDLAILQVDGEQISTVAKLGSSEHIKVGETVLAIGNPLSMEFANSLTKGIVSGLDRSVPIDMTGDHQPDWSTEVIQTDAAINPGNSGGALVDKEGNVIGINSMKIAQQAVEGIGFAIPIDTALPIMEQLEKKGKVERPYIGIVMATLDQVPAEYQNKVKVPKDVEDAIIIANVERSSPAEQAGLKPFDIITKIDKQPVTSLVDFRKYLYSETTIGESITLEIYRDGTKQTIKLQLSERNPL